jgi:hypothetical protein
MGTLICFSHPTYKGKGSPLLSCKTCCGLFLAELRLKNAQASESTEPVLQGEKKV